MVTWEWVLEGAGDEEKRFLQQLVAAAGQRPGWRVVEREGRFLLGADAFDGIADAKVARARASEYRDAIVGMADVLDIGVYDIKLGNSITVRSDG